MTDFACIDTNDVQSLSAASSSRVTDHIFTDTNDTHSIKAWLTICLAEERISYLTSGGVMQFTGGYTFWWYCSHGEMMGKRVVVWLVVIFESMFQLWINRVPKLEEDEIQQNCQNFPYTWEIDWNKHYIVHLSLGTSVYFHLEINAIKLEVYYVTIHRDILPPKTRPAGMRKRLQTIIITAMIAVKQVMIMLEMTMAMRKQVVRAGD